jgi:nitrite reductase/ring-hydroxylating ferredoxin subunit
MSLLNLYLMKLLITVEEIVNEKREWTMNQKARDFYAWLNACPFKIWKIEYDSFGKTTVSFIWDEDE